MTNFEAFCNGFWSAWDFTRPFSERTPLEKVFGFITMLMYLAVLGTAVWVGNTTMFGLLFGAGAFAGLAQLVRSYQKKNGDTP